jgi:hypothetical protein
VETQIPDEKLKKAFYDFIEMRKSIKSPLTENALKLAIKKASELSGGDSEQATKIVEQSVLNDWKGLYPVKDENQQKPATKTDWISDYYKKAGLGGGNV